MRIGRGFLDRNVPDRYRRDAVDKTMINTEARLFFQDNFTMMVFIKNGDVVSAGVAKRNPEEDADNPSRAIRIATTRAYARCT